MYTKRGMGEAYHDAPASKRLRHNLASLFCENLVAATRCATLVEDADAAGAQHVRDLRVKQDKNVSRNLLRKLRKGNCRGWPKLYYANVRCWSPKTQSAVITKLAFLLPHELVHHLVRRSSPERLSVKTGMSEDTRAHMEKVSSLINGPCLGIGLWCDGVPCNWDRSKSVEVVTMFLPGLDGRNAGLRFPITALPKQFVDKNTYDGIMKVMCWSMEALAAGVCPSSRHDDMPWSQCDRARAKKAGAPLGMRGVLSEMRGDWSMYSSIFRLGGWTKKRNMCWKCDCARADIFDFSISAPWRRKRMSHVDMLVRWRSEGLNPSPVFSCPFFSVDRFKIDWLHTVDLGCAAEWIGNLFNYILPKLEGNTLKEQCSQLFLLIKDYYARYPEVPARYDNLQLSMFRNKKGNCRLRGKAAEVRGLVGFAAQLALAQLSRDNAMEASILEGTLQLDNCYACLSKAADRQTLPIAAKKFCLLWKALSDVSDKKFWRIKPKAHLLIELAEYTKDRPSDTWCYRDEEFGGTVAGMSRIRGGKVTPFTVSVTVLKKFCCNNRFPAV